MFGRLAAVAMAILLSPVGTYAAWKPHPAAVQTVYQDHVPHTDRTGRPMERFDADRSFFPLVLYHALQGEHGGIRYELKDDAAAGFNACMPYEGQDPRALAEAAEKAKVQLIIHQPSDEIVKALAHNPAVLGWYLDEEPTSNDQGPQMESHFAAFVHRREQIRAIDPGRPVFALDVPLVSGPLVPWWIKWNTAGDVSAHDDYPINQHHPSLSFPIGLPESVTLAARSVKEAKPVWVCLQAFEGLGPTWPFTMPSTRQLRCMVYTAIVHGATGIMYFALDSHVTRFGSVVGMAPTPRASYGANLVATAEQLRMSRELWDESVTINKEIESLRPALLSPTEKTHYDVALDDTWPSITPDPIRTLLKRDPAGGSVMLIVNIDAAPVRARIRCKGFAAEQRFEAAGAGMFQTDGDGFEMTCTPYDVRVVHLSPR
ncbi:MAG TPA: hypothetical protein VGI81_11205 [Tepidisphaeraceae bacterium]|jgi:hypothetical protein